MKNFVKLSLLAAMVAAPVMADESFGGTEKSRFFHHLGIDQRDKTASLRKDLDQVRLAKFNDRFPYRSAGNT